MFGFNPWVIVGALVALIAVAAGGYRLGSGIATAAGERELTAQRAEWAEQINAANARADDAASKYEIAKRNLRPKVITVTKEVDRVLQADSNWSDTALPVGVRNALSAAAAVLGASSVDGAVPVVREPSPVN
jgi:hypothetical protein